MQEFLYIRIFKRNIWWFNIVSYLEKWLDFVLPKQVLYEAHLPENIIIFILTQKQQGRIFLTFVPYK